MGYTVKKNTKLAIEPEITQGTYVAPSAGASFIQVKSDGLEITPARELLERNILGLGLAKAVPRTGLKSVTGSIPVEMKAGDIEGAQPEYGILLKSLLGSVSESTSSISKIGNTTSRINIQDADISKYSAGDLVVVKEAGAYHTSPISAVDATLGAAYIDLLVAATGAFSNAVVVSAVCTYKGYDSGHTPLSVTKYIEDARQEIAKGAIVTAMSVNNFTTGQLADLQFSFEGLDFDQSLAAPAFTPAYDSSESPVILDACIYMSGQRIDVNEFSLSIENTLAFIQNTCDGKKSSRVTDRAVSGSINPYKLDNDISNFTKFNANSTFSLFVTAHTPSGVDGEYIESVSFYLPNCIITELGESDADGVLQESISFQAGGKVGLSDIYISMS